MKIDPEAAFVVLHHSEDTRIQGNGTAETHVRMAYRVLRPEGVEAAIFAELVGEWYKIKYQKGWHQPPGGAEEILQPEKFALFAPPGELGIHTDNRMMLGQFDNVQVGSVVAFEYDRLERHEWAGTYQRFLFQHQEPVVYVQFRLQVPSDWRIQYAGRFIDSLQFDSAGSVLTWTGRNLAYRPEEPMMPPWFWMNRVVQVNCYSADETAKVTSFPSWDRVSVWLDSLHFWEAQPSAEIADFSRSLAVTDTTLLARIQSIATFVQREIRYVAIEIGKGGIIPRHAQETFRNRYGDCKDKVTLMRAMLSSIGVPSTPVLIGANTWVSKDVCSPFQFDHCILGIPDSVIGDTAGFPLARTGHWLIFDPTNPAAPFGYLPITSYGRAVLIASGNDNSLAPLQRLSPEQNTLRFTATATLSDNGSIRAEVRATAVDDLAAVMAYTNSATSVREQIDDLLETIQVTVPGAMISNYAAASDADSSWVTYTIAGPDYLQRSGDLSILKMDFLWPGEKATFRKAERMYPLWFGPARRTDAEIRWILPETWAADAIDSIRADCRVATVSASATTNGNELLYRSTSEKNGEVMEAAEYAEARAFQRVFERISNLKTIIRLKKG